MRTPNRPTVTGGKLQGVLARILFSNEENHFCIGELDAGKSSPVVIAGHLPGVQCGETLELEGDWSTHPIYGPQFKFTSFRSTLPSTLHGIRKYLGSGLVPGIGKNLADRIVDRFGAETLRIISEDSGRLREVDGIGPKRAQEIKQAWDEQRSVREIMVFLQTYGVSNAQCRKLVKHYGPQAGAILRQNPYRVAREIYGIGFKTADRIAHNLGFASDSPARLEAGILHILEEMAQEGHTGCPPENLQRAAVDLLKADSRKVAQSLEILLKTNQVCHAKASPLLQLPNLEHAENQLARAIAELRTHPCSLPPIQLETAIQWAQRRAGFAFAPAQTQAVRMALESKCSVLTGGPGTGKTTILRAVVDILQAKKVRLLLASPTGRAAQRLADSTGASAQTLHRLLKFDAAQGRFLHDEAHPLHTDYMIVDEASMLDTHLAAALLRALPPQASLLLVGDIHQLPSVGPGQVLKDIIASQTLAVTRLDQIFRQKEQSGIITAAHQILSGNPSPPRPLCGHSLDPSQDLFFLPAPSPELTVQSIVRMHQEVLPNHFPQYHLLRDVQVLAPMHRGTAGIDALNQILQETINPQPHKLVFGQIHFRQHDKVIQLQNNYEKGVFNGDLGTVETIDPPNGQLRVRFDNLTVEYDRSDLQELAPAYAISVHKSQGSEFPVVIIPLLKQYFLLLQRNLLYTAITRGRNKVFLVGDPEAYTIAVRNSESQNRWTDLERKLRACT